MPRIGRHPFKETTLQDDLVLEPITVTTIVHIPMLDGFWEKSLDVLTLFFESLFHNTSHPFDLMVFDNNSCAEVQDYLIQLRRAGKIQFLTLSQYNMRKLGALNYLLSVAPGDYIAFADSDVYFLPGWLDASLQVLDAFPEAARVTALPLAGGNKTGSRIYQQIQDMDDTTYEVGHLIPDRWIDAHRVSIGKTKEQYNSRMVDRQDLLLKRDDVTAYETGADFQFTIRREAVEQVLPLKVRSDEEYYDPIYSPVLEHKLSENNWWMLGTEDYYIHHMGNRVPDFREEIGMEAPLAQQKRSPESTHKRNPLIARLSRSSRIRRIAKNIHVMMYKFLHET